jgi:hypothetical protein
MPEQIDVNEIPESDPAAAGDGQRSTPLTQLVARHRLLIVVSVFVLNLMPYLLSIPYVNRWEARAVEGVLLVLIAAAHFNASMNVLRTITVAGAALIVGLVVAGLPDDPNEDATAGDSPVRTTRVGAGARQILNAYGHDWVLRNDGNVQSIGADGQLGVRYSVAGPAESIASCAKSLLISHGDGMLARLAASSGRRLADLRYGDESGQVICHGGFAFVTKPAAGTVVQLTLSPMRVVREFQVVSQATSITADDDAVWVLDAQAGTVVGIRYRKRNKTILDPINVGHGAAQILSDGTSIWILHQDTSCVRRLDTDRRLEIGPGVPVGPFASRMHRAEGRILVADWIDGSIVEIETGTVAAARRPIKVAAHARLSDAAMSGDRLLAVDERAGTVVSLSPKGQEDHEDEDAYAATPECQP